MIPTRMMTRKILEEWLELLLFVVGVLVSRLAELLQAPIQQRTRNQRTT
jgi:hypothetical protein